MRKSFKLWCAVICLMTLVSWIQGQDKERVIIQTPFKPVKTVYPEYPDGLKKKAVAARVVIYIHMDRRGKVERARALDPLYPEIAETLEKTLSQWEFEPYVLGSEPVSISGFVMVIFFPGKLMDQARISDGVGSYGLRYKPPENKELQMILDKCAEYCMKLQESALYYVCDEEIKEKLNRIKGPKYEVGTTYPQYQDGAMQFSMNYNPPTIVGSEKHVSVYDYQLVRKHGHFKDRRILMEKDGKEADPEEAPNENRLSYNLKPVLVPNQILGVEHRARFTFNLLGEKKRNGEEVYVIEANLRPKVQGNIRWAEVWVDKSDFRIIKIEMKIDFVPGFESILSECYRYYLKPHFKAIYTYEVEKKGLLFPKKAEIQVEYSGFVREARRIKSEIKVSYKDYKFFTVKTDHDVIKKKLQFLLFNERKLPVMGLWK